nr:hypothetical protein [Tanacetum cinerariifolium]
MTEAVREAVQIQTDRLQDSFQRENDEFLRTIDENMKKIINGQVKSQVKEQVSRILPRIKESVNAQLEAEVLTRSSHSSRTSYTVAADLTEMELKKILIEKMEGNKSIQRSDEQQNLYKAMVDAYEVDKTILESYGDTAILKRRRGDDDDQEGHSAGSDRGSKRRREGGEPESASTPSEPVTISASRSTTGTQSRQISASESDFVEEPVQTTCQMDEPSHSMFETGSAQTWISELGKQADSRSSFNELLDTLIDFSNFIMNRLGVDTLTPELLAGPTYELMRGSCTSLTELKYHLEEVYKATTDQLDWVNPKGQQYPHNLLQPLSLIPNNRGHRVIPFAHFINNDLEYLRGGASSRKYTTSVTKTKATDYGHIKWIEDLMPRTMWIQEPLNYDKHALWGVSHWGQKRKLSNLTVKERSSFNVSLRMFTKSIVIQRRVEDLQLGVESYQKRLNLTKPDISPVNTDGPSFVNAASPSSINVVGTPASTNAFEEHPFKRFSPFKNAFSLPHVPIVTLINDTRNFGNAYADEVVEEEVDMNNVVLFYTIPDAPLTKFLKDHPKDQVIGSIETPVQTRQMTKINEEHEEGIDNDEDITPVARIESIRLFLAYASFKDFVVYQMDVKSAFLYGNIEEETASTPMEPNKALVKDPEVKDVDVHLYKSMIGSLMYLTASRPDITFVVCACVRFEVTLKTLHLYAVKIIFRYLKGQPKLGLWYSKDSPFDLEAYFDSDYAGASLDRKSTTGGCQFLGKRLILWQCKKQTIVANSTTEA